MLRGYLFFSLTKSVIVSIVVIQRILEMLASAGADISLNVMI